jgi:hypothetical protein
MTKYKVTVLLHISETEKMDVVVEADSPEEAKKKANNWENHIEEIDNYGNNTLERDIIDILDNCEVWDG